MITLTIVFVVLSLLYYYSITSFKYWKTKGIKHDKPVPLFGNCLWYFMAKKSLTDIVNKTYWKYYNEKAVGLFRGGRPELIIKDLETIKHVFVTDFVTFNSRGLNYHEDISEPMMKNVFFAKGDLWRLLRQRMTPAFTTSKLKGMFPLIMDRAEKLQARALAVAATGQVVDVYRLMARYAIDFIATCGFGLDINALEQEDSPVDKLGEIFFKSSIRDTLLRFINYFIPSIGKRFKVFNNVEVEMVTLTKQILEQRNYEPSGRNDFVDLLLECKKKGLIVVESIEHKKPDGSPEIATLELDDVILASQIFIFFAAGFETSSSTTSYTLHLLAYYPEVQRKVQEDIDRVLSKYGNKLCYDAVKEMTYLEWAFKESMRIHPAGGVSMRVCAQKTHIPNINTTIDKGVRVLIPVYAIHHDPKYFDNPEEFRPERFSPEEFSKIPKFCYLPFGEGPRACIGERLALIQALAGLAAILSRFTVEPAPESTRHPAYDPLSEITLMVKGQLPLLLKKRSDTVT
ncbi:cytochrome P450 6B5 [Galleria mellonella]|uniref:unspecific monooxygenase n=1 Tax=Galleria mellonella TaxID=7137 RepID=A0A3G1T1F1_GALME|nr:cytochrome P450 6B5 [Galleria mellonella]AXY94793.1 cytochrome P450 6B2-like [Galleria mellonella]